MVHKYIPNTPDDIRSMLDACHLDSIDDLFGKVPPSIRLKSYPQYLDMEPFTEEQLTSVLQDRIDDTECDPTRLLCFAGGGYYDHSIPEAVDAIASRPEFLTSYTPYQPEVSQGTLRYIFEYQSMICALTGMEVSNASMYDGATATAEAMMMAVGAARKCRRVLVSATLSPYCLDVVRTYAHYRDIQLEMIPESDGVTDLAALDALLAEGPVAGVILPQPNYYGIVEEFAGVADKVHAAKGLMIMNAHAGALGMLRTPGEWGADIACGEAQALGIPLNCGGPYLGYLVCSRPLMRKLPGRIVGATTDSRGQRTFVLTLQAREQHIRREKATSNICSNQSLMALRAAVYCSLLGPQGLREVCTASFENAHILATRLVKSGLFSLKYPRKPYYNEFAVRLKHGNTADFLEHMAFEGIVGGIALDDRHLLVAVTERHTPMDIDTYIREAIKYFSNRPSAKPKR